MTIELSESDRQAIETLAFDATLQPTFDMIKSCLIWSDERPSGISQMGYRFVSRLWIVRGFIHRSIPDEKWGIDPTHYRLAWEFAVETKLRWPGFERLRLSAGDTEYLGRCLQNSANELA